MATVGVHQAKTQLSDLLRRVEAGEDVVICRGGTPVARLVPVPPGPERRLGFDAGLVTIGDDFEAPLPDDVLRHVS